VHVPHVTVLRDIRLPEIPPGQWARQRVQYPLPFPGSTLSPGLQLLHPPPCPQPRPWDALRYTTGSRGPQEARPAQGVLLLPLRPLLPHPGYTGGHGAGCWGCLWEAAPGRRLRAAAPRNPLPGHALSARGPRRPSAASPAELYPSPVVPCSLVLLGVPKLGSSRTTMAPGGMKGMRSSAAPGALTRTAALSEESLSCTGQGRAGTARQGGEGQGGQALRK